MAGTLTTTQGIVVALVVYFSIGYLNEFAAENTVWRSIHEAPLYDRIHAVVPPISTMWPDVGLVALLVYFVVRWGVPDPKVLENYLWLVALLFVGRVLTFSATQVPPPRPGCSSVDKDSRLRWIPFANGWKECEDEMYSGHTIHAVLIAMFVLFLSRSVPEKVVVVLAVIAELVLVIVGRLHYTADVLVAVIVTALAYLAWPGVDAFLGYVL